ncbi:hypothetical protein CHD5UKE2_003 [Escherichia phage vB_EcoS-CHD5UKE2]|uniref:Uncharacterized protein n=2 Tax=Dhillonvirus TaxID=1623289 RepID=A0AAE7XSM7_9CAUD|nr:hypothetical protein P9604_gp02 [Escherichia phage vB_EcoS-CHD5UKE2]YP_010740885.1 hypothetical protein P9606_gp29 [Escherichia phage vB_EcoS-101114BS4]QZI79089.1 hypothetical protein 101114BS4_029 [Escherichia phage vB_EcoS-101114BS4]USL86328.1 hypothetical protein CHD5UKE2_003 [Escherichia phage vB_EcoS-CHD5UKE2]
MGRGPRRCLPVCCAMARQREDSRSLHRLLYAMAHRIRWGIRHRLRSSGVAI